ncbi:coil containing protein [Vibrio phage 150E35-1]|nr:coil containing protein [Vibrio phage 150E35-1]
MCQVIIGSPKEEPSFCFGTNLKDMIQIHPDGSVTLPENMPADDAASEFWKEVVDYGIGIKKDNDELHASREELEREINSLKLEVRTLSSKYNEARGLLQYFVDRVKGGGITSTVTFKKFSDFLGRD